MRVLTVEAESSAGRAAPPAQSAINASTSGAVGCSAARIWRRPGSGRTRRRPGSLRTW